MDELHESNGEGQKMSEFASTQDVNNLGSKVNSIAIDCAGCRAESKQKFITMERDMGDFKDNIAGIYELLRSQADGNAEMKTTLMENLGAVKGAVTTVSVIATIMAIVSVAVTVANVVTKDEGRSPSAQISNIQDR